MFAIRMLRSLTNLGPKVSDQLWSMNYATVKRLSLEEKLGLPERPKKPSSPYLQFCGQKFTEFSKMHPGSTFTDIAHKLAEAWKLVDIETKTKMMNEFHEKIKTHPEALQQYYSTLTDAQRVQLEAAKKTRMESLKKIRSKFELRKSGKPTRPTGMFGVFVKDVYSKKTDHSTTYFGTGHLKEISKVWNNLTPEEKAPYKFKYEKDEKEYRKKLAEWEEEMIRQGKANLVRSESQPIPVLDESKNSKKIPPIKKQMKGK
ncbi:hypothetical protein DAPPUDRAFT_315773 [Daphnia pulex]|uniref:HMG box domain-containing protein n=1 Tax=Daphnia pulex TaxID=6669 RepID=E9GAS7_DAPPU|nr:hypothetical protein DAPPUDRAFT_315773 [Daphnia pulex]|eukprot:EFX83491.1 hypothetical protein DAPPUDRAFT_315773 [Daphnia pulex]